MTTATTSDSGAKKDTQKLQRSIVDGLEDVKAQDIQVFNTEHLSPLFERVIVASGTSNRQTRALAASVRDAVREAGFGKPRIEGEENGEWIIVDCGQAVVHIMQPAIRQYYHLEELWGEKPVRLKFGAAKPALPEPAAKPAAAGKTAGKTSTRTAAKTGAGGPAKSASAKSGARAAPGRKAAPRKPPEREIAPERPDMTKRPAPRKAASGAPARSASPKTPTARKAVVLKTTVPARKAPARAGVRKG